MFDNKDKNQPVTIGDFQEFADMVVNHFATKEDLKNELKNYVTKDDLKQELSRFATKEDLRQELKAYATKEDFNGLSRELRGEMTAMKGEFTEMKNEILNSNDKVIKKLDTFLTEKTVMGGQIKEQCEEVGRLKSRVTVIEKHIGIEPVPISI